VRITNDLVVAPALIDRALDLIRVRAEDGTTVSQLREHLGTSRKYAVPLVEWMDRQGLTRRRGDLRFPR
jgi:selenocysteine-specific elongation factor